MQNVFSHIVFLFYHRLYGLDGNHVEIMMANNSRIWCSNGNKKWPIWKLHHHVSLTLMRNFWAIPNSFKSLDGSFWISSSFWCYSCSLLSELLFNQFLRVLFITMCLRVQESVRYSNKTRFLLEIMNVLLNNATTIGRMNSPVSHNAPSRPCTYHNEVVVVSIRQLIRWVEILGSLVVDVVDDNRHKNRQWLHSLARRHSAFTSLEHQFNRIKQVKTYFIRLILRRSSLQFSVTHRGLSPDQTTASTDKCWWCLIGGERPTTQTSTW